MSQYDVAIIGGGLIACATAYYLSRAGSRVIILERGQLNQEASGRNAGSLHFQLEHRLIEHKDTLKRELEDFVALTMIAVEQWRNIETELGCDLQLVMNGGLMVAESAADIKLLQEKAEIEKSQGLQVDLLDGEQARAYLPGLGATVQAALHCADEGQCNPRLLTPAFARNAAASGTDIVTRAEVNAITRQDRQWRLAYSRGGQAQETVSADLVLNAAGAWAPEIAHMAGIDLPLLPVGLILNVTEKAAPFIPYLIQHVSRKLSMKQVPDGNLLIGGGWLATLTKKNGVWQSRQAALIDTAAVKQNLRVACDLLPAVSELNLLRSWTGITTLARDELPVLGEIPGSHGFYVAAGGNGFTLGPTYARLMSELMLTGSSSFPLTPYAPQRLLH